MRELRADDRDLLLEATLCNVNWVEERFTRDDVLTNPYFRHYYDPWQESDFGYVAENSNGEAIGVVWLRFFTADDPGFGFVDEATPELSIWVAEGERGRGIGGQLLDAAIRAARSKGLRRISLSVEEGNPARRLYERAGFAWAGEGLTPGRWCWSWREEGCCIKVCIRPGQKHPVFGPDDIQTLQERDWKSLVAVVSSPKNFDLTAQH